MTYYKFVSWEPAPIEAVLQNAIPRALAEYDAGNKKPLQNLRIATTRPEYRHGGWCFPLRSYLRRFWVKTKHYGIMEYWATNKTAIRDELHSDVLEIVEVTR